MAMSSSPATAACDVCGWAAAVVSALAFGSFGVPIKSRAAQSVQIDPLVFQSYKTLMCFLTTWPILYLMSFQTTTAQPVQFTYWGLVSGLFWVPGGVATVFAVQSAGLAIGIGIGSSFIVFVSFVWGIFVFAEPVHSKVSATLAIFCMMTGLLGMSYYSAPATTAQLSSSSSISDNDDDDDDGEEANSATIGRSGRPHHTSIEDEDSPQRRRHNHRGGIATQYSSVNSRDDEDVDTLPAEKQHNIPQTSLEVSNETLVVRRTEREEFDNEVATTSVGEPPVTYSTTLSHTNVVVCGCKLTRRQAGMLSALFCGIWGGSITAPMAYAPPEARGIHYLMSFAIGASIVNLCLWILRYLYNFLSLFLHHQRQHQSYLDNNNNSGTPSYLLRAAYDELPSFHLRIMWLPGGLSGLLWSIGNFFSLISVFYLGEGVGYPLVQTSILISGLWGMFYYQEVTGADRRTKWFASSLLTIFGILLLSYEHHER